MSEKSKTVLAIVEAAAALRAGTPKSAPSHRQMTAARGLDEALDDVESTEKGLDEWRGLYVVATRQATAARATAQIAIQHLQATLVPPSDPRYVAAFENARLWLESIGSEPQ